ncbi:MAG: ABC transporter ATP-binding protein [Myxococcota bacterium]
MTPIVELERVEKEYPLGNTRVRALLGIDLQIGRGEFLSIAGPSGSGKTTALNLIGCVDVPTRGDVRIDGQSVKDASEAELTRLRLRKLGFIFQSFNLVPVLDVFQNVELPLLLQGGLRAKERRARVETIVEQVGLSPQIRQRPNELSGGQRQRVAIARALVTRPSIVLADEPTANLDSKTGASIIDLMKVLNRTAETTFIFSTHDPSVMAQARRVVRLVDGRIESDEQVDPSPDAAPEPEPVREAS